MFIDGNGGSFQNALLSNDFSIKSLRRGILLSVGGYGSLTGAGGGGDRRVFWLVVWFAVKHSLISRAVFIGFGKVACSILVAMQACLLKYILSILSQKYSRCLHFVPSMSKVT